MTKERFEEISQEGGFVDLSARAKWLLRGGDRVRYLNGQVTNNIKTASESRSVYACVTNVKGRVEGDVFVHSSLVEGGQVLVVDAEPGLRETLGVRLDRYIIADDAELVDVSDEWQLWHAFGGKAAQFQEIPLPEGAHRTSAWRFGQDGVDLWWPVAADAPPSLDTAGTPLTAGELEVWRICAGVPAWPDELNTEVFPPEAGLQERAMDYAKGCYIGQEILSRIKTTGKMPQSLVRLQARENAAVPLSVGALLFHRNEDGKESKVGHVTSVTRHPVHGLPIGLGYVKQAFASVHSLLLASEEPPKITFEVDILTS
ncbi:glycine cleavage T C-terminal barrel domain-containing protein [Verrucomicrobium sp. BvORR106]|uniref:CAF17-like 4Fe-4S cluster assembly/insertion protein YgfZ n=1 Tax=Verrucomicrobium sp. BvORR106 TaxID=1403819 RepID=UPI00056FD9D4|nr:glycine cleavage T C-terminal barrel domain-containing protein [Verrucomicrobium sp. BvORR106]